MRYAHHFGAAGDGETDDTSALQHALEAGAGVLRLNKGVYRLTKPLVLNLPQQGFGAILGEGGTSRILMTGPGPAIRIVGTHQGTATPSTFKPQVWEQERFPTVRDIEIVGEHPEAVGIELYRTMQTTISRVLVRRCKHGIHLVDRNRNFLLSESHIYENAEYGLFLDRCNLHQIIVQGNHISYNRRAGIKSLDGDVHNLQITGNDIEYNNSPGVDESPHGEPTGAEIWFEATNGVISEVTIASNTIQATIQPGGANIRIWGPVEAYPRRACLIAISGNIIGSQSRAIELADASRVAITGNTIYGSTDLSVLARRCSEVAVGSNTFATRHPIDADRRDGLRFENCDNCSILGAVIPATVSSIVARNR
jgi:hypothetical protein